MRVDTRDAGPNGARGWKTKRISDRGVSNLTLLHSKEGDNQGGGDRVYGHRDPGKESCGFISVEGVSCANSRRCKPDGKPARCGPRPAWHS